MKRVGCQLRSLAIAPALFCAACSRPEPPQAASTQAIQQYEASQRTNLLRHIDTADFRPLSEATAEGRELRRIVFWPPYGSLPLPGLEIERLSNGRVLLRLVSRYRTFEPAQLPESTWSDIVSREEEVFRSWPLRAVVQQPGPLASPRPPGPPPPPPPICHAWSAVYAATGSPGERVGFVTECWGPTPHYEYANFLARIAVATRPDCPLDQAQPMYSFLGCFMIRPTDDENSKPS